MTLKKIVIIILTVFSFSAATLAQNGYEIKVQVKGVSDSLCYLANYYGDKQYLKDSINADKEGRFVFKGEENLPGGIYLIVVPGRKYFEVIVDKEQKFTLETVMDDFISQMKITGSKENTIFYDYLKFIGQKSKEVEPLRVEYEANKNNPDKAKEIRNKIAAIDSAVFNYKKKLVRENPDMMLANVFRATEDVDVPDMPLKPDGSKDSSALFNYYKSHFFDNIDFTDDRLIRTPVFHPKLEQYLTKMTLQHPDSIIKEADMIMSKVRPGSEMYKYVVWWITNHYETSNIMGLDAVFVHMVDNYYTKEKAYWVQEETLFKIQDRAKVLKPILIGKKVKNLVLTDSLGRLHSLHEIKEPFTVLYFWDPDCGHCQKVTPKLKELYDKVHSKGVEVYAVCTEVEMDKWKKFIREKNLDWINVADPQLRNNFRHEFDITTTPQIFLLDNNKQIIAKRIEVDVLEEILNREFEKMGIKKG